MSELLYSHEEMLRNLQMLCRRYRPLAFARTTALTRDGRAIVLFTMGNFHAKKQLLIQASIHGREYTNPLLAMTGKMGVWNGSFFYFHIYLKKY